MKIDHRLNLVIPVEQQNGVIFVHAMPILRETFDQHHFIIGKAFSAIYDGGLGVMSGPRIAAKVLRDIAKREGVWDGPTGVEAGIIKEITRLSNVVIPEGGLATLDKKDPDKPLREQPDVWRAPGWSTITLHEAIQRGLMDEEDRDVVENASVFFTVVWSMHGKGVRNGVMATVCGLWSAQMSSLSSTAFAASLPTSTVTVNSGATAPAFVHPS
jgi:hypothetical protein